MLHRVIIQLQGVGPAGTGELSLSRGFRRDSSAKLKLRRANNLFASSECHRNCESIVPFSEVDKDVGRRTTVGCRVFGHTQGPLVCVPAVERACLICTDTVFTCNLVPPVACLPLDSPRRRVDFRCTRRLVPQPNRQCLNCVVVSYDDELSRFSR